VTRKKSKKRDDKPREVEKAKVEKPKAEEAVEYDSDLAPAPWQRFDLLLAIGALAILSAGTLYYRSLTAPSLRGFDHAGLHFDMPNGWLPAAEIEPARSALAGLPKSPSASSETQTNIPSALHVSFDSPRDPDLRIEVRVASKPAYNNLRGALTLQRVVTYGGNYWARSAGDESIGGRDWLLTRFQYADRTKAGSAPAVHAATEYAILNGNLLYVVTLHGSERDIEQLDELIVQSLRVDPNAVEAN